MLRHGEFNQATILAIAIAVFFVAHIPLVAGLVSRRDRGWRRAAYFFCLIAWLLFVFCVTFAVRGLLAADRP